MEGPAIVSHDQSWRSGKDYRIFASEKASPDLVNLRNCSCKPSLKIPITSPRYATRLACRNQHWPLNQTCHKNHPHSLNPPSGPNQFQDKPLRFCYTQLYQRIHLRYFVGSPSDCSTPHTTHTCNPPAAHVCSHHPCKARIPTRACWRL